MEISGKIPPIKIEAYINNVKERNKVNNAFSQASGRVNRKDKVELSQTAIKVNSAREELASIPDIRAEKVEEIKKQVDGGTYAINGEKIAFNMIRQSVIDEIV